MEEGEDLTSPGRHSYAVQIKGQEASHKKTARVAEEEEEKRRGSTTRPGRLLHIYCSTFTHRLRSELYLLRL